MAGPHRPRSAAPWRLGDVAWRTMGGPKGSEQGDVIRSLLQNSDPQSAGQTGDDGLAQG